MKSILIKVSIFMTLLLWSRCLQSQNLLWQRSYPNGMNFSSMAAHDLDKNGVQELIIGLGTEDSLINTAILVLNADGNIVWEFDSPNQLYTQPIFKDITGDGIDDVFMGGRMAGYYAVDGSNGNLIWQFWNSSNDPIANGWYNFYGGCFIPDVNNDGVEDILVSNGGDPYVPPFQPQPAGKLVILNTLTGQVLHQDTMPDGQPTYNAPVLYPNVQNPNNPIILYGSGGETLPGKFYKTYLQDLINNNIQNSLVLASDTSKGFISQVALADFNLDGHLDILATCLNSKLYAIDGQSYQYLWVKEFPNYELYSAPSVGLLNADIVPDVSILIQKGQFPVYQSFKSIAIEGVNGNIIRQDSMIAPPWQVTPACIIDWNQDGIDETVHIRNFNVPVNQDTTFIYSHLVITDYAHQTLDTLPWVFKGTSLYSQPLIRDIDNNGWLDLIFTLVDDTMYFYRNGIQIYRLELPLNTNFPISWAGYTGTHLNATFINPHYSALNVSQFGVLKVFPNPNNGKFYIFNSSNQNIDYQIFNLLGQSIYRSSIQPNELQIQHIIDSPGNYLIQGSTTNSVFIQKFVVY